MISICIVIGSGRQGIVALHAAAMVPLPILLRRVAVAAAAATTAAALMPSVFLLCER